MKTFIMNTEQLETTIINGHWFAGLKARWKRIRPNSWRVTTNYVISSMEPGV